MKIIVLFSSSQYISIPTYLSILILINTDKLYAVFTIKLKIIIILKLKDTFPGLKINCYTAIKSLSLTLNIRILY
jgi:hypothetical protein